MDTMFRHLRNKQAAAIEYLEDNRDGLPDQKLVAAR